MKPLELYIHIPFCVKKCNYCDFLSAPSTKAERQSYVGSLCEMIRSYEKIARAYLVVSIFVGGGTPSILTGEQMRCIFEAAEDTFTIAEDAEITIEMNPGTVTEEKLAVYKEIGINRLSIGLQSVNDEELKLLGRIHTYEDFLETYRMARKAGFSNINIDLISAIPGQTTKSWERTLRTVAELCPEHISAYSLIIEEGTPFYELYGERKDAGRGEQNVCECFESGQRDGRQDDQQDDRQEKIAPKELPSEDEERKMYEDTKSILSKYGYHRYEISNYAKEGYECRHNLGYWNRTEYLGIGSGAASLLNHQRFVQGETPETLDGQAEMEEYMFLGLRKTEGVSKSRFEVEFSDTMEHVYGNVIEALKEQGLLIEKGDFVRLTERGIDVSNYVMSEFLL